MARGLLVVLVIGIRPPYRLHQRRARAGRYRTGREGLDGEGADPGDGDAVDFVKLGLVEYLVGGNAVAA